MSFDQLVAEIRKLSHDEQIQLKDLLNEECFRIDPELEREHLAIIEERMRNPAPSIPGEEVFRRIRKIVDER